MPDADKLINAIDAASQASYNSEDNGDLAAERAQSIDMYMGRNVMPAPDGRSQVVDRSVYETVQWIKPSLARIFANGDDVVNIPPVGPEDEAGAKQESQYLNHIVLDKNNWFEIFDTAATDCLLTKAAYLYPYVEKRRQPEIEKYERQTPESLALIMQDQPEIISQNEYPDPDYQPQPQPVIDPMTGQPAIDPATGQPLMMIPPPPMLYDVEIRRTKEEITYCIEVLPPERCKIAESTKTVQLRGCTYFEYWDYPTISDLRADGYEIEDDIGYGDEDDDTLEDTSRDQFYEDIKDDPSTNDPSMRRVKCRWVWIRHDYDEDGIAELQYCVVVGRKLLHREEVNRIPIAVLCPDPLPHRHIGLCPADSVKDLELITTDMLRQGLDNLRLSNNPQKFGDPQKVNLDDMMVSRPGGITRTRNGAVFMQDFGVYQVPNVFPDVINALGYMDMLRKKRTGVDFSFQGLEASQLSQLQPGTVNQVSSMAAQRVEHIARNIANGIVELFSILHEIILKSGHKRDVVKLSGKWVTVNPSEWRARKDFRISVGFSAGNKDAQVARLMGLANLQKEALAGGLRICTEENAYNTAIELTKASDFSTPERFWTDPKSLPPPNPPQPDPTLTAIEQIKAQASMQTKQLDVEQKERDSLRDAEIAKYQTDVDANVKLTLASVQAQQARELEAQRGEQGAAMEHIRAQLNPKSIEANAKAKESTATVEVLKALQDSQSVQTEIILKAFEDLSKALSAPREFVRDPKTGKAIGSRVAQ